MGKYLEIDKRYSLTTSLVSWNTEVYYFCDASRFCASKVFVLGMDLSDVQSSRREAWHLLND